MACTSWCTAPIDASCILCAIGNVLIEVVLTPVENRVRYAPGFAQRLRCIARGAASERAGNELWRNIVQEARGFCILCLTKDGAATSTYQVETTHCSRKAHIGQAAFLFQLLRLAH